MRADRQFSSYSTSTHFKYYRGEHILSDAKSALRENAKMQTRADEPLKVRLRRAIFTFFVTSTGSNYYKGKQFLGCP